jgi:hypothetical protein
LAGLLYAPPQSEFIKLIPMAKRVCTNHSANALTKVISAIRSVEKRKYPIFAEFNERVRSPIASTATPISTAAEHQKQNNDNQDQFHRHGMLHCRCRPICRAPRP